MGDEINGFTVKEILIQFREETKNEFASLKQTMATQNEVNDARFRPLEEFKNKFPTTAVLSVLLAGAAVVVSVIH